MTADQSPENEILAKGNNCFKSGPRVTKAELYLYNVMTNLSTKF